MFSFCKKKNIKKIEWSWGNLMYEQGAHDLIQSKEGSEEFLQNYMTKSTNGKCNWWKNLPAWWTDHSNRIIKRDGEMMVPHSVKHCPAIRRTLSDVYLLTAPCDFTVVLGKNDKFKKIIEDPTLFNIATHRTRQFSHGGDLMQNKTNVKLEFPIVIRPSVSNYLFLQPVYHEDMPYQVMPAILEEDCIPLFVNVLFDTPKDTTSFSFKKGQVLAYLWFPEPVEFEYKKHNLLRWFGKDVYSELMYYEEAKKYLKKYSKK